MKKAAFILLILVPATVAHANPIVIYPHPVHGPFILSLLVLEIFFTYKVLTFYGLAPAPTLAALVVANTASYLGIVRPSVYGPEGYSVFWIEVAVFVTEATFIILLSRLAFFRKDPSVAFRWRFALLAVLEGNLISCLLGFA